MKRWVVLDALDRGPHGYLPHNPWPFDDVDEAFEAYREHRTDMLKFWRRRQEQAPSLWANCRLRHPRPIPWAVAEFERGTDDN